jgi:hypothetical protein
MSLLDTIRRAARAKAEEDDEAPASAEGEEAAGEEEGAAEDDDTNAENDDEGDDKDDAPADDEDDDEEDEKPEAKKARAREQRRIKAILSCKSASRNPGLAAHLAFDTRVTSKAAARMLGAATPAQSASPLAGMHARNPNLGSGAAGRREATSGWGRSIAKANARVKGRG